MKKIFYLVFFISLCFLFNIEINAEEIDCATHPYACVKCTYDIPTGGTFSIPVYYNGSQLVFGSIEENYVASSNSKVSFSNIEPNNFYLKSDNKLFCPTTIYYKLNTTTSGNSFLTTYELDFSLPEDGGSIELTNSEENGKNVYANPSEILSCLYQNNNINFNISTDGKSVWYSSAKDKIANDVPVDYFKDNNGNFSSSNHCPTLYFFRKTNGEYEVYNQSVTNSIRIEGTNSESGDDIQAETYFIDGTKYKELLGALKSPLGILAPGTLSYPLTINGSESNLNSVNANSNICSGEECNNNSSYYTEKAITNIRQYCNTLYGKYADYKNVSNIDDRMDECISFSNFYDRLVDEGVIRDLSAGCDIFSDALKNKLIWILNIVKVVGPILALGLGTLDFIKVLATGDADKEMKTAFKRFMIRLGAAALLFLIPLILAFLLDIFLGNQDGYNSDNPFCIEIDWDE